MKTIVTDSIILKRIEYGEADRILTVLTKDHGKVQLLAKGVRKSKSKLAGGLELFSVATVSFIDGKSDLKTVVGVQLKKFYGNIMANVERTMVGYEFMKLSHTYTQDQAEERFFEILSIGLSSLDDSSLPVEITDAWFRAQLLITSGEGIALKTTVDGAAFSEGIDYEFDYEDMGFRESTKGSFSPKHIKFLRLLTQASTPSYVLKVQGSSQLLGEISLLLRRAQGMHY